MSFFGFGKSYSLDDLQEEITKLQGLYRQAIGVDRTTKPRLELKRELALQLQEVLKICEKGKFKGWETVEWCPQGPPCGQLTCLRNVAPPVQILLEIM